MKENPNTSRGAVVLCGAESKPRGACVNQTRAKRRQTHAKRCRRRQTKKPVSPEAACLDVLDARARADSRRFARLAKYADIRLIGDGSDRQVRQLELSFRAASGQGTQVPPHPFVADPPITPEFLERLLPLIPRDGRYHSVGDHVREFLHHLTRHCEQQATIVRSLAKILYEVATGTVLAPRRQLTRAELDAVFALPADLLDHHLVVNFVAARIAAEAKETTTNTTVLNARIPFQACYRIRSRLRPPRLLSGFLTQTLAVVVVQPKEIISPKQMRKLFRAIAKLERIDPRMHTILLVVLYCGLRASEVHALRWDWIHDALLQPTLHVRALKGSKERIVTFPRWLFFHLAALRSEHEQFVLGENAADRRSAYQRTLAFLRQHGLGAKSNPLHFCRGISLTMRVFMGRLEDAQQTGGHTGVNVTYERYVQDGYTDEHFVLALKGPGKTPCAMPAASGRRPLHAGAEGRSSPPPLTHAAPLRPCPISLCLPARPAYRLSSPEKCGTV